MKSIISWVQSVITKPVPELDLSPITGKAQGKRRLSPEEVLEAIHGAALAEWALAMSRRIGRPRLPCGRGGRPPLYWDSSLLLMAVVQMLRCQSYEQIVDWVSMNERLALALGLSRRTA